MRKIYIIISLLAFVVSASAQITLSTKKVSFNKANTEEDEKKVMVSYTTSDPDDTLIKWTIIENTFLSAWGISFCDPVDCISQINPGFNKSFTIKPSESKEMKFGLLFNNTPGTGKVTVSFNSVKNPAVIDTVYYTANAWSTATKEVEKSKEFSFYPNPVRDQLTIKYAAKENVKVEIFNLIGMKVKTYTHDGNSTIIQLSDLKKGVYFIRVTDGGHVYSKQFSKID